MLALCRQRSLFSSLRVSKAPVRVRRSCHISGSPEDHLAVGRELNRHGCSSLGRACETTTMLISPNPEAEFPSLAIRGFCLPCVFPVLRRFFITAAAGYDKVDRGPVSACTCRNCTFTVLFGRPTVSEESICRQIPWQVALLSARFSFHGPRTLYGPWACTANRGVDSRAANIFSFDVAIVSKVATAYLSRSQRHPICDSLNLLSQCGCLWEG